MQTIKSLLSRPLEQKSYLIFTLKWLFISAIVGSLVGSASAFFLWSLDYVTHWRENNFWIIAFLPLGGFIVGAAYHYLGSDVVKGNNQLLEEFHSPKEIIPFKMAPLVFFATIITHLVGGSAGREGTAVQMGGAIADQFTKWFKFDTSDRKILIVMGISAGFASVFGTPLAGTIFALEVLIIGRMRYEALLPSLFAAIIANYVCLAWQITHTHYQIPFVPTISSVNLLWAVFSGIMFGITAILFSKSTHFWADLFKSKIAYPPLRPVIGGIILAIVIWAMATTKYIGLGVPTIVASFSESLQSYDFLLKILFTSFTLGAGFKGGEVTPLFFIGAALGNALVWFVPLPLPLLAGMGFVGVFAGASNTPIACTIMGIELFGAEAGVYLSVSSIVSYLFSGHTGIYTSQIVGSPKHQNFDNIKGKKLNNL
ncbi:Cl- channel voltage-gated family protein (plasmid) [Emticicia oligotrophica DSM 17448]|uniref:Cl-channel voltage-gated family protein n=1 Tax=Emticicia oligotrophica (strain DSM 17448 / CIP 109782 / MTCC 6937 / GPTSA100-15) TaxID=929562 RepID=A0ABM5N7W1_EMTOG|nr:voltage-gated chloride channel family protein [Emticicia oligotrophica]AFK05553.1 Cl- channel voltage-gated family protein [Emticicia oligotrophica DSM 17448]